MSPLTAGQLAPLFHFPGVLLLLSSSARVHRPGAFLVRVLRVGGELKRRRRDHGAEVRESPKPHSAPFVFCLPACLQRRRRSFPSSAQLRQRSRTPARARRRRQKSDDELTVGCFPPQIRRLVAAPARLAQRPVRGLHGRPLEDAAHHDGEPRGERLRLRLRIRILGQRRRRRGRRRRGQQARQRVQARDAEPQGPV